MPVAIRNLDNSTVSLSSRDRSSDALTWKPAGDPDGEDVQLVPDDFAKTNVQLMRAMGLGILATVDEDEASMELAKQAQRYQRERRSVETGVEELVQPGSTGAVVFTQDALDQHIERVSKGQKSDFNPTEGTR